MIELTEKQLEDRMGVWHKYLMGRIESGNDTAVRYFHFAISLLYERGLEFEYLAYYTTRMCKSKGLEVKL